MTEEFKRSLKIECSFCVVLSKSLPNITQTERFIPPYPKVFPQVYTAYPQI